MPEAELPQRKSGRRRRVAELKAGGKSARKKPAARSSAGGGVGAESDAESSADENADTANRPPRRRPSQAAKRASAASSVGGRRSSIRCVSLSFETFFWLLHTSYSCLIMSGLQGAICWRHPNSL